ncbi:hypothetical protein K491DRAFT_686815 [Lophiostoma macrostomum CBS 122681]|uniref:Zinc knuckle-domain-containing protein n=1 Tax=Lophiostoma macrostomum CBS 122681 TaxID=1314788 RepID=A0A6A6TUP3_9PLEO|nr:hypothetical protein K491DRAFT_686815 [Lophiostoma macrostomum CBS 122681]
MYRGPGGGRSKATASTQCQKCLKRGHYSYECTVSAQERPYKPRPSRTQQLLNPNLKPKLTTDVPNELVRKAGIADELLAKKEEERGRKQSREGGRSFRKGSRSVSSHSSDSVSTISTNRSLSRSRSPQRNEHRPKPPTRGSRDAGASRKRERSISSHSHSSRRDERNTRRRMSSFSPPQRGRRGRSGSSPMDTSQDHGTAQKNTRRRWSRSMSSDYHSKPPRRRASPSRSRSRSSDRMDTSQEPTHAENGLSKRNRNGRGGYRSQSRSSSRERGRGRRFRSPLSRSRSPFQRRAPRSPSPFRASETSYNRNALPKRDTHPDNQPREGDRDRGPPPPPPAARERSLSPYSKRVAMTRQTQVGR